MGCSEFGYKKCVADKTITSYTDGIFASGMFSSPIPSFLPSACVLYYYCVLLLCSRYEGAFREDKRHGEGTLTLAGGGRYGKQIDL